MAAVFPQVGVLAPEDEDTEDTPLDDDIVQERLPMAQLAVDRIERASLIDHFLGSQAAVHNFERQQFPEVGDFTAAEYQVLRAEPRPEQGLVTVHLARDGAVSEGDAVRLVRVVKQLDFHRKNAGFMVSWTLSNRSQEPFDTRFAVEFNLNLDSARDGSSFLLVNNQPCDLGCAGTVDDAREVAWGDLRRSFRMDISLEQPAQLWHHPVQTISEGLEGPQSNHQGICVVLVWPLRLWGLERHILRARVSLRGKKGAGSAAASPARGSRSR